LQATLQGSRVYEDIGLLIEQWQDGKTAGITPDTAAQVPDAARFGSFLRAIPASRRVRDYAHAAARVVNAILKRVYADARGWGHSAAADLNSEV
jgi:hypothetical protein